MNLRMLALPRYAQLGASSRLRTLQYLPALMSAGIQCDVHSLLDDDYVSGLYTGQIRKAGVAKSYVARIAQLLRSGQYDLVWTEKELLPWLPDWVELGLLSSRTRLVVDCDDAVFHRYDQHSSRLVRCVLGAKIDSVMRRADLVTAGSRYLADRALKAGANRVEIIPTVIDLARYQIGSPPSRVDDEVVIGWIGSPSTAGYLIELTEPLRALQSRYTLRCLAIGARPAQLEGTPFEAVTWTEESEVTQLRRFDIGVMPLPDMPWERGKCGYKLIQYMALGLPVVASAVGANIDVVEDGKCGALVRTQGEWENALETLIVDAKRRKKMGEAGRKRVEDTYSQQVQAPRLVKLLRDLAAGPLRP